MPERLLDRIQADPEFARLSGKSKREFLREVLNKDVDFRSLSQQGQAEFANEVYRRYPDAAKPAAVAPTKAIQPPKATTPQKSALPPVKLFRTQEEAKKQLREATLRLADETGRGDLSYSQGTPQTLTGKSQLKSTKAQLTKPKPETVTQKAGKAVQKVGETATAPFKKVDEMAARAILESGGGSPLAQMRYQEAQRRNPGAKPFLQQRAFWESLDPQAYEALQRDPSFAAGIARFGTGMVTPGGALPLGAIAKGGGVASRAMAGAFGVPAAITGGQQIAGAENPGQIVEGLLNALIGAAGVKQAATKPLLPVQKTSRPIAPTATAAAQRPLPAGRIPFTPEQMKQQEAAAMSQANQQARAERRAVKPVIKASEYQAEMPVPASVEAVGATKPTKGGKQRAIQEQVTDAGVLRQERPEVELQGVPGKNVQPEAVAGKGQAKAQEVGTAKEVWQMTKEELIASPPPGYEFVPGRPYAARRQEKGKLTRISDDYFTLDERARKSILKHEEGHDLITDFNRDFADVLEPHRINKTEPLGANARYDNPFGFSQLPEEVIADTYATLFADKPASRWYESDKYNNLVRRVVDVAMREGLPVPPEVLADYPDLAAKYGISAEAVAGKGQAKAQEVGTPKQPLENYLEPTKEIWQTTQKENLAIIRAQGKTQASDTDVNLYHRGIVRNALEAGKPVPSEVLADYPDLAAKYGISAEATPPPSAETPLRDTETPQTAEGGMISPAEIVPVEKSPDFPAPLKSAQTKPVQGEPLTGTKKAIVEAERAERGLNPVEKQAYTLIPEAYAMGKAAVEGKKVNPVALATSVAEKPRPLNAEEVGALGYDRVRIINEYDRVTAELGDAIKRGDAPEAIQKFTDDQQRLKAEYDANDAALERGGREQSAAFQARKMLLGQDFSYLGIEKQATTKKGTTLTPQQETLFKDLTGKLANVETELAKAQDALKAMQETQTAAKGKKPASGLIRLTDADRARIDAAKERIRGKLSQVGAAPDVTILADVVEIGSVYVQAGVRTLKEWRVAMKADLPNIDDATLDEAWKRISLDKSRQTRLGNQIADLSSRIQQGNFSLPSRPKTPEPSAQVKQLQAHRDRLKAQIVQEMEKLVPRTRWEKLSAFQRNNLLSSPRGAGVDVFSTGVWQAFDNTLLRTLRGGPVESFHALRGMYKSIPLALEEMKQTFLHGYSARAAKALDIPSYFEFRGGVKNPFNLPVRTRGALNEGQRTMMEEGAELYAQAYRGARKEKLQGAALRQRMAELVAEPTPEMEMAMQKYGEESTFTQEPDFIAKAVNQVRFAKIPDDIAVVGGMRPFQYIVPFYNTVHNLTKTGVQMTPAGYLSLLSPEVRKNPAARRQAIVRATVGSGIMAMLSLKAAKGEITGDVPDDPAERAQFFADGKQEYSWRIGEKWVEYKNLGPLVVPIAMTAAFWNRYNTKVKQGETYVPERDIIKSLAAIAYVPVETVSLFALQQLLDGKETDASRIAGGFASGFVPYSSALRTAGQATDEWQRDPKAWYEWVQNGLPYARERLPIKQAGREPHKKPLPNRQKGANALLPIKTQPYKLPQEKQVKEPQGKKTEFQKALDKMKPKPPKLPRSGFTPRSSGFLGSSSG